MGVPTDSENSLTLTSAIRNLPLRNIVFEPCGAGGHDELARTLVL